jgi:excinuclease ABC subunit B
MEQAIKETERRRKIQEEYNKRHGIKPQTVIKSLEDPLMKVVEADFVDLEKVLEVEEEFETLEELKKEIAKVEKEMKEAAKKYEFERAAILRDRLFALRQKLLQWE